MDRRSGKTIQQNKRGMNLTPDERQLIESLATLLRNLDTYDDWEYGTETIPHDRTWCQSKHEMLIDPIEPNGATHN